MNAAGSGHGGLGAGVAVESARETSRAAHGGTGAGAVACTAVDGHTIAGGNLGEVGTRSRLRLARDAREERALGSVLVVRGSDTLRTLGTSVETLVQVGSTSSLAETSLHEVDGSTSVGNISLNLEGDRTAGTLNNRLGSIGVWNDVSHWYTHNLHRVLQVGAAEEEVWVAVPEDCELVTMAVVGIAEPVVGIAEPVVEIMELLRSTELLVDDMVLFPNEDEFEYDA